MTIIADPPPAINIDSTYEFQLFIHDPLNEQNTYERARIINLNPKLGITLNYGLVPNRNHTIVFKHIVPSIGYSQAKQSNISSRFLWKKFSSQILCLFF